MDFTEPSTLTNVLWNLDKHIYNPKHIVLAEQ